MSSLGSPRYAQKMDLGHFGQFLCENIFLRKRGFLLPFWPILYGKCRFLGPIWGSYTRCYGFLRLRNHPGPFGKCFGAKKNFAKKSRFWAVFVCHLGQFVRAPVLRGSWGALDRSNGVSNRLRTVGLPQKPYRSV